ncbi:MAG: hypothetical protein R6U78_05830 [Bacteroidales bacterium]
MMRTGKIFCPALFLLISLNAGAQINIFLGGNLQGNYSWIRGDESTFKPGFGGGFSFVYWEYEYWFIKAGLDYANKSSSSLYYPEDYGVPIDELSDKTRITFIEQNVGIPLTVYFRPIEQGDNTLLITGTLEMMFVVHLKENSAEYGELVLTGNDVGNRTKTCLGLGVGYQRQLAQHTYLNIVPSFNLDLRSARPFNTINLTAELIFGVY